MFDLMRAQEYMRATHMDAWLIYDFRGSNPVLWQIVGQTKHTGRRVYLFIPKEGPPHLLAHFLDKGPFEKLPYERELYTSWVEMRACLQELLGNCSRVAMEYSPGAALHALGVNLDNYETHDTRDVLPGLGFSVEPGIYLPEFGVRSEINVFIDPKRGPMVTTPIQDGIITLG